MGTTALAPQRQPSCYTTKTGARLDDSERRTLENELLKRGLNGLDSPELIQQLAALVQDHWFLMGLLNEVDQPKRYDAYEALRPYLKFKPWPLEDYISAMAREASERESRMTPVTVGVNKMRIVPRYESTGVLLTFTCAKCTKVEQFFGETPVTVAIEARKKGWVRDVARDHEICPKCPAIRVKYGNS